MAKRVSSHFNKGITIGKLAGELREIFKAKKLIDFRLVSVYDNAPAVSEIEVILNFEKEDRTAFEYLHKFRLIYEDETGETVARGYKEAEWKIMMLSLQKLEFLQVGSWKE